MALALSLLTIALSYVMSVPNFGFIMFAPAVIVAALIGGLGPGVMATAVCGAAVSFLWIEPTLSFDLAATSDRLAGGAFLLSGTLMSGLIEVLHRMRYRAEQAQERLREALESTQQAHQQAKRLAAETRLLFRLAEATARCEAPSEIYEPALDGVRDLLEAERASILLLDADDVMRFKAWRGLSESYRAAIESYAPWSRDGGEPDRVVVADVERDEGIARHRALLTTEGIRTLAFVPLVQQRRWIGTLTLGWGSPRTLSEHDQGVALTIASHLSQALARATAHDELRRAEEKLSAALDAGRMGAWTWDPASGRMTWSATLEEIHGLSPGTFAGTFEAYQSDIHPEDKEHVPRTMREAWEARSDHLLEYRIVRPDGDLRWLATRGKVIQNADGHPVGMAGVCMDVTGRKELERLREAAAAELERSVRFYELFTGILAHDLRNPLGAVTAAAQLALTQNEGEKLVKPLSRILSSSQRMARMIDQLLDFTRMRMGGGLPIEPGPIDLVPVLRQVVDELDNAHAEGAVRFEHDGKADGTWDPDRLAQVFSNLIGNALQHGVTKHAVHVRLDGSAPDTVKIEVHNMGSIPAPIIPKIFTPLVSGEQRRSGSRGLGLGLFISREIITSHGGTIDVRSDEATGTTFTVVLPRTPVPRPIDT